MCVLCLLSTCYDTSMCDADMTEFFRILIYERLLRLTSNIDIACERQIACGERML